MNSEKINNTKDSGDVNWTSGEEGDIEVTTLGNGRPWIMKKLFPTGYCHELRGTLSLAWPIVATQVTNIGMQTVAIMMGGHLGKIELDALTLANTLINIMGTSVAFGAAAACDTTFSQTYGSGNKKMVGVYLQRSLIIMSLILCVTLALFLNVQWILSILGQDPEVSRLVGQYLLIFIPGIVSNFAYIVLRKYLQCQDVVYPHIVIGVTGLGIHTLLQYLLLYQAQLGIPGSSLAQGVGYFVMFIGTLLYTICSGAYKDTWAGWTWRCLEDWDQFFRLAIFGVLMTCLEWWAFEVITILAGILGTTELAAFGVVLNLDIIFYSIPSGFGIASSIRVGQFLGAGQPREALNSANVGMSVVGLTSLVAAILFATLRWELPKLFTEETDVIALAAALLPMTAVYTFFDNIAAICRGVFQGAGRQGIGTVVVFISYYFLAMPIGIPVMFLTPLGLQGMWAALTGSIILTSIVFLILLIVVFDWDKMSEKARKRAGVLSGNQNRIDNEKEDFNKASCDEKTPLLLENSLTKNKIVSNGLHIPSTPTPSQEDTINGHSLTKSIILRRVFTILLFVGILVVGVVLRTTVPINVSGDTPGQNSTVTNGTSHDLYGRFLTEGFVPFRVF